MEEAEARRQKLQALKERAKRAREGGNSVAEEAPKLKFRNYQPKTDEFKDGVVAPVKISADKELEKMGAVSFPHSLFPATLLLSTATLQLVFPRTTLPWNAGRCVPSPARIFPQACHAVCMCSKCDCHGEEACVFSLCCEWQTQTKPEVQLDVAPKKANWDLKQHISKKLEKLERRTQQAIVDLIKAKVADDGDAESGRLLAAGVSGKAS